MKKFMPFLLSALLILSLAACESNGGARNTTSSNKEVMRRCLFVLS